MATVRELVVLRSQRDHRGRHIHAVRLGKIGSQGLGKASRPAPEIERAAIIEDGQAQLAGALKNALYLGASERKKLLRVPSSAFLTGFGADRPKRVLPSK